MTGRTIIAILSSLVCTFSICFDAEGGRKVESIIPTAVRLMEAGRYDDADKLLQAAEKLEPDNDAVQYYRGMVLLNKFQDAKLEERAKMAGVLSKAGEHLTRAVQLDSTNLWYAQCLGNLAFMFERNAVAKEQYGRILKQKPYDPDILVRMAGILIGEQDWRQADSLLVIVETLEGKNDVVDKLRLDVIYGQERFDDFFLALRTYVTMGTATPEDKCMLIGKFMSDAAHRADPWFRSAYNDVIQCFIDACRNDQSVAYLAAELYRYMGDYERVLQLCESKPDDIKLLYMRLPIDNLKGNMDAVMQDCDKIISLAGDDVKLLSDIHCTKADCYQQMDQFDKACKEYELSLKNNPENVVSLNNYAYCMSCKGRNLSKCRKMIEKVIAAEPENPTYLDTYGWILFKQKRYGDAKEVFKKVMQYGGKKSAEVMLHYAAVLEALGETALATSYKAQAEILMENVQNQTLP